MHRERLNTSWLLAWRTVTSRPWRALLLCGGFGVGVAVMIVLLAVGEAMVQQASQERLVGGGQVTVLPEGIDIEVLTTGGLGGLFFSVPNARFVHRQVLTSPRLADAVTVAAPQLEGKLLYLTTADGVEHPVRATGEVPSATRQLGAMPDISNGVWNDDAGDLRWTRPTMAELRHDVDRFHRPTEGWRMPIRGGNGTTSSCSPQMRHGGRSSPSWSVGTCAAIAGVASCSSPCTSAARRHAASSPT